MSARRARQTLLAALLQTPGIGIAAPRMTVGEERRCFGLWWFLLERSRNSFGLLGPDGGIGRLL